MFFFIQKRWPWTLPVSRGVAPSAPAKDFCIKLLLLLLLDPPAWLETSASIGSGLSFLRRGSTASRKPFLAFGALWAEGWGLLLAEEEVEEDEGWVCARDSPAALLGWGAACRTPLKTNSWMVSMGDVFPSGSTKPSWLRWEREWLPRPLRLSNSSPQRMQTSSPEDFGFLAGGCVDRPDGRLKDFFEVNWVSSLVVMGFRSSSSMIR